MEMIVKDAADDSVESEQDDEGTDSPVLSPL